MESNSTLQKYQVRYCELQSWGAQRCRTHTVEEPEGNQLESAEETKEYVVNISGLRMATTYSFEIKNKKEGEREDRSDGGNKNQNVIVIPTKGCK